VLSGGEALMKETLDRGSFPPAPLLRAHVSAPQSETCRAKSIGGGRFLPGNPGCITQSQLACKFDMRTATRRRPCYTCRPKSSLMAFECSTAA
jgi:hypothetical protein